MKCEERLQELAGGPWQVAGARGSLPAEHERTP